MVCKRQKEKITTSKVILAAILLLCVEIIIYAEIVMWKLNDLTSLYVLIGIPGALAAVIWGYYSKSKAENSVGGITYEVAMLEEKAKLGMDLEVIDLDKGEEIAG